MGSWASYPRLRCQIFAHFVCHSEVEGLHRIPADGVGLHCQNDLYLRVRDGDGDGDGDRRKEKVCACLYIYHPFLRPAHPRTLLMGVEPRTSYRVILRSLAAEARMLTWPYERETGVVRKERGRQARPIIKHTTLCNCSPSDLHMIESNAGGRVGPPVVSL